MGLQNGSYFIMYINNHGLTTPSFPENGFNEVASTSLPHIKRKTKEAHAHSLTKKC